MGHCCYVVWIGIGYELVNEPIPAIGECGGGGASDSDERLVDGAVDVELGGPGLCGADLGVSVEYL